MVRLLVQLVKPRAGQEIYDPTVGSGGFLIQSHQFVEEQGQDPNDLALYGQDSNGTVWSICIMNMILHNITRFTIENADTLTQQLFNDVERELRLTGFWESIPARNKLRADIQKTLLQAEFSKLPGLVQNRARIISRLMEIAEKNNDAILYAA